MFIAVKVLYEVFIPHEWCPACRTLSWSRRGRWCPLQAPGGHCDPGWGGENNVRRQLIGRPFRVAAPARQCDWLPGVMGLHDGSSVLIAERQKVEEVSEVEQRVHVVLKRVMRHTCERHARRWLFPNRRWFGGRIEVWLEGLKSQPKDTEFRGPMAAT